MPNALETVEGFFRSLEADKLDEFIDAFRSGVTDDFVWANSGFPTCNGPEEAVKFLENFATKVPLVGLRVEMVTAAINGEDVVTERVDHFLGSGGIILASLPMAGTLVVREGKVAQWRDYFDPRPLLGP